MMIRNLIANPGFESGALAPWTGTGSISTAAPYEGGACASITRSTSAIRAMSQPVNIMPGRYHMGAAMYCRPSSDSASPYATLLIRLDDGTGLWTFKPTVFGRWFTHDEAFTIPTGRVGVGFELWTAQSTDPAAAAFFDNVILTTQSDWQAMQTLGLTYFDGGTMPLAS